MFEDFSFCTECEHYDRADRLCKLFQCVRTCGCSSGAERKPRNNFERLKNMSIEELAEIFETLCPSWNWTLALNGKSWLEWLKEEAQP